MSDNKYPDHRKVRKVTLPSQIPLLEDVVNDLTVAPETVLKTTQRKKKITPDIDPLDKPLATDLFGDPIHSYALTTDNCDQIDEEKLHSQATQVVNSLVKEYSHEIVRRLRNELTSILNDLNGDINTSKHTANKPPQRDSEPDH